MDIKHLDENIYCILDTETTGLSTKNGDKIIEISIMKIDLNNMNNVEKFDYLLDPEMDIPYYASKVNGIYNKDVIGCKTFSEISKDMLDFIGDSVLVIQNAKFDIKFLNNELSLCGLDEIENRVIDTIAMSKKLFPDCKKHNLDIICDRLGIDTNVERHRAIGDVMLTAEAFILMRKMLLS